MSAMSQVAPVARPCVVRGGRRSASASLRRKANSNSSTLVAVTTLQRRRFHCHASATESEESGVASESPKVSFVSLVRLGRVCVYLPRCCCS